MTEFFYKICQDYRYFRQGLAVSVNYWAFYCIALISPIEDSRKKASVRQIVPVKSATAIKIDMPNTSGSILRLISNVMKGSHITSKMNT